MLQTEDSERHRRSRAPAIVAPTTTRPRSPSDLTRSSGTPARRHGSSPSSAGLSSISLRPSRSVPPRIERARERRVEPPACARLEVDRDVAAEHDVPGAGRRPRTDDVASLEAHPCAQRARDGDVAVDAPRRGLDVLAEQVAAEQPRAAERRPALEQHGDRVELGAVRATRGPDANRAAGAHERRQHLALEEVELVRVAEQARDRDGDRAAEPCSRGRIGAEQPDERLDGRDALTVERTADPLRDVVRPKRREVQSGHVRERACVRVRRRAACHL